MVTFKDFFIYLLCWSISKSWALPVPGLRLWIEHKELAVSTVMIPPGSSVGITCDGASVGGHNAPAWYGPDKRIIKTEDQSQRISTSVSYSPFINRKLIIQNFQSVDEGKYTCLGKSKISGRWILKDVTIDLDNTLTNRPTPVPPVITTSRHVPVTTTTEQRTTTSTKVASTTTVSKMTYPFETTTTANNETNTTTTQDCFQCGSGECVSSAYRCDGYPDCIDASDEANCGSVSCVEGTLPCKDGSCIAKDEKCDGVTHCPDGSDEDPKECNVNQRWP